MYQSSIKRVLILAAAALIMVSTISGSALAAATSKSLSTNFTLVNLGPEGATVNVEYLTTTGAAWAGVADTSKSFSLAANGGQRQIRQYAEENMAAGSGSAVVSSDQPLGAVVQIQARGQGNTVGAYVGASTGSDTFYVPLVAHHGSSQSGAVNSQIIIQNAGTGSVNVEVEFIPGNYTKTISNIAEGASYYYDIETEGNLPNNWFGSAVVRSTTTDGNLVVVSNLFSGADGVQVFNAFSAESLTDSWVVPIFVSRLDNGLSTVVTVQNLSGSNLAIGSVTLSCVGTGGTKNFKNTTAIADNASYSFNPVTQTSVFPAKWVGACTVTAAGDKNIVSFVQMRVVGQSVGASVAAYEAIPADSTATSMYVPLVAKALPNGFATVVNIANLSGSNNTVSLDYVPSSTECPISLCDKNKDGTVDVDDTISPADVPILPNGGNQRNHRFEEPLLPAGWVGSLKVTSVSGLPIGGIVQLTNMNQAPGDTLMAHDAFVQ